MFTGHCGDWEGEPSDVRQAPGDVVCMMHTYPSLRTFARHPASDSGGVIV
ncbi:hypothetical protein SAMN04487968_10870 [Nocardioides terrae]|uniref:Uncharacterized protein n=1 Tax=Nocardioides terrae TaxID=574651 RepID=A0A1I1KCT4_9ACTN|nr:hypothetical protein [Nocardioides terrae]SFC58082.1 hypothetical protein SAMN04487968_10870 [Nocardioides terrae]